MDESEEIARQRMRDAGFDDSDFTLEEHEGKGWVCSIFPDKVHSSCAHKGGAGYNPTAAVYMALSCGPIPTMKAVCQI